MGRQEAEQGGEGGKVWKNNVRPYILSEAEAAV